MASSSRRVSSAYLYRFSPTAVPLNRVMGRRESSGGNGARGVEEYARRLNGRRLEGIDDAIVSE